MVLLLLLLVMLLLLHVVLKLLLPNVHSCLLGSKCLGRRYAVLLPHAWLWAHSLIWMLRWCMRALL